MDARRGEIYAAVYDAQLQLLSPEVVTSFQSWIKTVRTAPQEIISPDFAAFRPNLTWDVPVREQRTIAAAIARIAEATAGGAPRDDGIEQIERTSERIEGR